MATHAVGQSKIKQEHARKEEEGKEGREKRRKEEKREGEREGNLQIIIGFDYSETSNQGESSKSSFLECFLSSILFPLPGPSPRLGDRAGGGPAPCQFSFSVSGKRAHSPASSQLSPLPALSTLSRWTCSPAAVTYRYLWVKKGHVSLQLHHGVYIQTHFSSVSWALLACSK